MGKGRPKGSANVDWGGIVAELRKTPNTWRALTSMAAVPERTITTIRRRERAALRLDDAVVRVRLKAYVTIGEQTLCTLFLKLETKEVPRGQEV